MLLAQNEKRETVYHLAAERIDEGILEKMWIFAREAQDNSRDNKKIVTSRRQGRASSVEPSSKTRQFRGIRDNMELR